LHVGGAAILCQNLIDFIFTLWAIPKQASQPLSSVSWSLACIFEAPFKAQKSDRAGLGQHINPKLLESYFHDSLPVASADDSRKVSTNLKPEGGTQKSGIGKLSRE
jgi:hypothetical protein